MHKHGHAWVWLSAGAIVAMLLLATIWIPKYEAITLKSRETTLTVNLGALREGIKQYTKDKHRAPQSLQELVDTGYFRELPIDPITNSNSTWQPVIETIVTSPERTDRGITDVRSGSSSLSSKGTPYHTW